LLGLEGIRHRSPLLADLEKKRTILLVPLRNGFRRHGSNAQHYADHLEGIDHA
jgi:hypothetical protein